MNSLSAYPALNKAFNRATLEFILPLILVCACSIVVPRILSDLDNIDRGGIVILVVFSVNGIALFFGVKKRLGREQLARELCEYADTLGERHEVLSRIDAMLNLHDYGRCIISDGWLIVAPDLERKGFFLVDEIVRLSITTSRHSYELWAVLADDREFKLSKNRRQAAIAYRAILKYNPSVELRPGDEDTFERLLGMWSDWYDLEEENPERLTLKYEYRAKKKAPRKKEPELDLRN